MHEGLGRSSLPAHSSRSAIGLQQTIQAERKRRARDYGDGKREESNERKVKGRGLRVGERGL